MDRKKILIVEDEGIVAVQTKLTLMSLGYDVLPIAISGNSAIDLAGQHCPDLVLMDIKLRGKLDGVDAAMRIISQMNIPVIFVTAHSDEHTLARARATNPIGILNKPVEEYQLREALNGVFNSGGQFN